EKKKFKTSLYKSLICARPTEALFEETAKIGIQGLETRVLDVTVPEARVFRNTADKYGVRVHSLMQGGMFNSADEAAREKAIETCTNAIKVASAYGQDTVLCVPARIQDIGPKPWDFHIEFDPGTCHVTRVVEGDNTPYKEYIRQQNEATDMVFKYVERLIPVAAYEGITFCLENVWNNLWVCPKLIAAVIDHFDCRWIKAYYDLGNHVKYYRVEDGLKTLGAKRIAKLHIKDFIVDRQMPRGGQFVPIGRGDINWISIRDTLEEIGFSGWVTVEDVGFYSNAEFSQILQAFFDGKLTKDYALSVRGGEYPPKKKK
ncbi:MAG: sugar phosphate isomerase/epimerase family protein, partial [Planctomycetia bacterium]|nr:sugar phosphate isomerase/epimerase family protein [Planctomycetia bacterium]